MDVVSADDVSGSGAADVDAIAITKDLHAVVDFVILDEVVVGVEEGADVVDAKFFLWEGDFVSADGADELAGVAMF